MKVIISGLVNIETTLKIRQFPINYYPVDYPFFGIQSEVAGVAYNLAKAFQTLGDEVELFSYIANDEEGKRILRKLEENNIEKSCVLDELRQTPVSVILYDENGKRQIYCDLKDIQEKNMVFPSMDERIKECDLVIACNTNFNRTLIKKAKESGKKIATDVHVLSDPADRYNRDFMQDADILFFSDEQLPGRPEQFLDKMKDTYPCELFVVGMGEKGAMLYERSAGKKYYLNAVKAEKIVNTIGAGDALFSSFLHYYGKGETPIDALKKAQIFAAMKIGHNGASVGFSNEEEIAKVYKSKAGEVQEIG